MENDDSLMVQIEEQDYHKLVDTIIEESYLLEDEDLKLYNKLLTKKRQEFDKSCGLKFVSVTRKGTLDGEDEFEDYVRYTYYHNFKVIDKKKYTWAKIKYGI
jgi:hypothetical protein